MYKTSIKSENVVEHRIAVNTDTLVKYLDCGRMTAIKIGDSAGARIQIGKRVLWNLDIINEYLRSISKHSKSEGF